MEKPRHYIAVDLGAESGRVMLAAVTDSNIQLSEMHRFSNGPVTQDNSLRWDFPKLMSEILTGIGKAAAQAPDAAGIGVDSWGVDYGLIDKQGNLLENPYHYRDSRTNGIMEKVFDIVPRREVYQDTGLQFMQLNTLYQVYAAKLAASPALAKADKLVFMADLVSHALCGAIYGEYTLASTSQMMNMHKGTWSDSMLSKLGIPSSILPPIVQPGTKVGSLKADIAQKLGINQIPVFAVGSHDTASAVAAVPVTGSYNWGYLSSGTWSLMGIETPSALINDKSYQYEFTNEGGVKDTIRFLKNIMGLWLVQECRRQWQREGTDLDYSEITRLAKAAKPFTAFIDPSYPEFFAPGEMPAKINRYLKSQGKPEITDKGQLVRAILESLALTYRSVLEKMEEVSGKRIDVLHIVGGGIKNDLLCQFTADALNRKVVTGPVEATAMGNIMLQAIASGQLASVAQGRKIVSQSVEITTYNPQDASAWDNQYRKAFA